MYDAVLSIPVTKEMQENLRKIAKEQEISMNQFCRDAMRHWINKNNKNDKKYVAKDKNK